MHWNIEGAVNHDILLRFSYKVVCPATELLENIANSVTRGLSFLMKFTKAIRPWDEKDIFVYMTHDHPVSLFYLDSGLKYFVSILLGISGKAQPSTFLLGTSITVSALQVFSFKKNIKSWISKWNTEGLKAFLPWPNTVLQY